MPKLHFFMSLEASHPDIYYNILSNIYSLPSEVKMLTSYFSSRSQSLSASQRRTSKASHKTWPQKKANRGGGGENVRNAGSALAYS